MTGEGSSSHQMAKQGSRTGLSGIARTRVVLLVAILGVTAAVWGVSETQRSTAERIFNETRAADGMLTAMLEQETGLRGFALTHDRRFLEPFIRGLREFNIATDEARALAGSAEQRELMDRMTLTAKRWRGLAEREVESVSGAPRRPLSVTRATQRKRVFDSFRRQNRELAVRLTAERREKLDRAGVISVTVILLLAVVFGGVGFYFVESDAKRARARSARGRSYRRTQAEFAEAMQITRSESEAHDLLKSHLERAIAGGEATVLNRSSSGDRLDAVTTVDGDSALAEKLFDAAPDSCLAVRLGREYEQGGGVEQLLACELCGKSSAEILCTPSLVAGEVVGSVLVRSPHPLDVEERNRISDSVSQASPVLANLRNLAIAENRAATDALTGLPNSRSCRDSLRRMVAHAGRTASPLSAVMCDLDYFKKVNDRFGHGVGDDVLAGVGEILTSGLRASDFGGRYGGEEFLVLLPDTDGSGALEVVERLRIAIEGLEFQQPELRVTASFGVATLLVHAHDADSLVEMADSALYAAKAGGRNRVELVDPNAPTVGRPVLPRDV